VYCVRGRRCLLTKFCRICGRPVRLEGGRWVHYDNTIYHPIEHLETFSGTLDILALYRRLKSTRGGRSHACRYDELRRLLWDNLDDLYTIMVSSNDPNIQHGLLSMLGHGGSVELRDNVHMVQFLRRLYAAENLPAHLREYLDWLVRVHDYPLAEGE